ncbi:hypothetical protein [Flavobacterium sp. HNIBRBA15423]|uniref:hypothetical protein n=1 Tax=Flavobacterium sp. HNIBRBA15423 TaxID=3458683 RepID=UPI0040451231
MHIIQIKKETETWLVAMCSDKKEITEYFGTLSEELQADASCFEIPIKTFPFIIIQHTQKPHDSDSYFEYCDFETLQIRIDEARQNRVEFEDNVYFKYYYINETYFQMITEDNFMKYRSHTSVTNYILDQPYAITLFHEEVKRNASNYDVDRLDELFEHTKTLFNSELEKEDLAINGYESLFWDMNYDHACGKLTDMGVEYLLPMVDKMEQLLGEKKWLHRSYALHILLEETCKKTPDTALMILKDTIEAFEQYLISNPEERMEIHRLLSLAYRWMIKTDTDTAFSFWQLAVQELEKGIDFDPERGAWRLLFELIYIPISKDQKIKNGQEEAQKWFVAKIENLEETLGATISFQIASAYLHLKETREWRNTGQIYPEEPLLYWAEKAIAYDPEEITRIDLHQCAEFFSKIGSRTKRIDFLVKTILLYERVITATDDCAMEVYYIANLWKQIADIHLENHEQALADEAITESRLLYERYIDPIKTNSSVYLHYIELLEYCYNYEGNISKPSLTELKAIATELEMQLTGFMSYPYALLMRVALYENNEIQAIVHATKCLILHELCVDSNFKAFFEEYKDSDFHRVKKFLKETIEFMEEVEDNYYFHPQIKWEKLSTMSDQELLTYWEKRKEEIRNRPAKEF